MSEEKKLYPMKFVPTAVNQAWGEDTIVFGDLGYVDSTVDNGWLGGNSISEVMDMFMDRLTGENAFGYYGRQFPTMMRMMDVKGDFPVLVCPDDKIAEQRYDALGKAKYWYVTEAGADAAVYIGFEKDVKSADVYEAAGKGDLKKYMHRIPVKKGDAFFIAPGVAHSASGKVGIAEIAESSGLDFNLAEDVVEVLDFLKLGPAAEEKNKVFRVELFDLKTPLRISGNESDYFVGYLCVSGKAAVEVRDTEAGTSDICPVKKGEGVVIPAEVSDYALVPEEENTVLLEVTIPEYDQTDEYINPDAEPTLPGEE